MTNSKANEPRLSRDAWLRRALEVLRDEGVQGVRVERLALPPGTRAVLSADAPAGARLEQGGWHRRTQFVRLVLEPGAPQESRFRVDFVRASERPSSGSPGRSRH